MPSAARPESFPQNRQWRVIRSTSTTLDEEDFVHFGDAWAYAQPDPDNGIYEYRTKESVHRMLQRHREVTVAYEGNTKIRLARLGGLQPVDQPPPHSADRIVS